MTMEWRASDRYERNMVTETVKYGVKVQNLGIELLCEMLAGITNQYPEYKCLRFEYTAQDNCPCDGGYSSYNIKGERPETDGEYQTRLAKDISDFKRLKEMLSGMEGIDL